MKAEPRKEKARPEEKALEEVKPEDIGREVFFESGNLILCGKVSTPPGEGPHPAVLILPEEGPRRRGEELFVEHLSRHLVSSGFLVLYYDNPGEGKSQGSFNDLDDEMKTTAALSALEYLKGLDGVKKDAVSIIGHRGSAYLALNAAIRDEDVSSCVMLSPQLKVIWREFLKEPSGEELQKHLKMKGYGNFESNFLRTVSLWIQKQLKHVASSSEKFVIFLGEKIPVKEYRDFLQRQVSQSLEAFDRPVLVVVGRNDEGFDSKMIARIESALTKRGDGSKVVIIRALGQYAGNVEFRDGKWSFVPERNIVDLVSDWLKKT